MVGIREGEQKYLDRKTGGSIFGSDISGYEIARLGYPEALYDALLNRTGTAGVVLEIGPGTGLATFDLLTRLRPSRFVGVEADPLLAAHMRARIDDLNLSAATRIEHCQFEDFASDVSFDFACCAAAFHWLDAERSLASLMRLLKPGGVLALWWNAYRVTDVGDAFADRIAPLLASIRLAPSEMGGRHYSCDIDFQRDQMVGAGFERFEPYSFRRQRTLATQDVVDLYQSYSYIRALPEDRRRAFIDQLKAVADEEFGGSIENTVITSLYIAQRPAEMPAGSRAS